jgi:DNA-directed RNA polymerase specialized sigma24 family protein
LASLKKDWVLTQDAFDGLLSSLDADRERAAERYEALRRALTTYFEFRDVPSPEELADETINRVARRLSEGREIYAGNPNSYFYGVARNVWREHLAAPGKAVSSVDDLPPGRVAADDPFESRARAAERAEYERRLECLEGCLGGLKPDERGLITDYYQGERDVKIGNRKALADRLGLPTNALRIRACRLRARLEDCVRACVGGG